ncbi:MAG: prepilin-type cleavage/methylation domain-containing protein [Gammaproteobacteria bacterium]|nr:prepilin-type cleavage/methylation domain-containing protein [Gammaproteobacteria bacterium]MBU1978516.1 prepilin-type cleavage/methylation domain-containing protein [Gammaproteobacteria bacterium]
MNKQKITSPGYTQQGVVMLEALIAILIFSMGVLAVVGLQAAMIKNTTGSKYRADASYIAQQRIGLMWSNQANIGTYVQPDLDISTLLPGGLLTVTQPTAGRFTVTVGWTEPGETPATSAATAPCFMLVAHCFTTSASISGG